MSAPWCIDDSYDQIETRLKDIFTHFANLLYLRIFLAWCVENESGFGRQNLVSVAFLRKIVIVGTAVLEAQGGLGTKRTSM